MLTEAQLGNMALRAKQQRTKAEQDKQLLQARASHHPELPLRNQEICWLSLSPLPAPPPERRVSHVLLLCLAEPH